MSQAKKWHAVEIVAPKSACTAAQALKGKRFLSADAPPLPLRECTLSDSCNCVYRKHTDRRDAAAVRRSEDDTGIRRLRPAAQDRRSGHGRRKDD